MKNLYPTFLFALLAAVLLSGVGKCFGQDSIGGEKILVIQRQTLKPWHKDSTRFYFKKGNRICLTKYNKKIVIGRLECLSDSSIVVGKKEIILKDIKRINRYNGVNLSIIGPSLGLYGFELFELLLEVRDNHGDDEYSGDTRGIGIASVGAVTIVLGACTTIVGLIEVASTKYYKMGDKWKLVVRPMKIKKRKMHIPNSLPLKKERVN
jgi:hypothetical protein